jgi:hypothetical protein
MTKHLALAFALLVGCKGKESSKENTAAGPAAAAPAPVAKTVADPAPTPAPTPAPVPAATPNGALTYGQGASSVQCAGFSPVGAYVLTVSGDNGLDFIHLEGLGRAEDPKLAWDQSEALRDDEAKAAQAAAPVVAMMNEFVTRQKLTPCAPFAGKLAGKDATVTASGQTVTVTIGGKKLTRKVDEGGDVGVLATFTNADASALVVGLEVTAEAMSKHVAIYFGPDDLK